MDEDVVVGPLINQEGVNKVIDQIKDAEDKGPIIAFIIRHSRTRR